MRRRAHPAAPRGSTQAGSVECPAGEAARMAEALRASGIRME